MKNKYLIYAVSFLLLSPLCLYLLNLYLNSNHFAKMAFFDRFMLKSTGWFYATSDIIFFGAILLAIIFLILAIYFGATYLHKLRTKSEQGSEILAKINK